MKKSVWMGVSGSCLGAALLPSARGSSDIAPKELLGIEKEFNIGSGGWRSRNVPSPSPKCSGSRGPSASRNSYVEIATWVFAVCEEGTSPTCLTKFNTTPEKRRAAAVWYYTKGESELRIKWAGGECELGGFIHSDTSGEIHFHRLTDMQPDKVKEYIEEDRVRGVPEYRVRTHVFSASGMSSVLIADLVLEQVITPHLSAKLFVVMNTPAAAPNQLESGPESDIVPQVAGTIPWITFGGLPNESSSAFVQCLQRIGFQQGRGRDDEWMAEYAATCFEGDALSWYAQLDDEIQESWKKLRAKLLQKYPPIAGSSAPPFTIPYPATVPAVTAGGVTSSTNPSQPQGYVGRIEVMANHTVARGYLSFNATSGIGITTDKDKAVIVSVPSGKASGILQLNMLNSPDRLLPYLGLALLVPQSEDPNVIPGMLPGVKHSIPEPSTICQSPYRGNFGNAQLVAFATWTFSACGESKTAALYRRRSRTEVSGTRAAAAVWKYDSKTEEFTMFWLMDDDTECELGGQFVEYSINFVNT
ncbi:hypothetical protein FRC05_000709 [Tulasnella sp. 425]|nr:hypothetical protein FRC05_000709 [Tulasnella sp. 425]